MSTPDAPWRVYLAAWVTVWTSDAVGPGGQAEALQHFGEKYRGRVRDEDWRVTCSVTSTMGGWPYLLELFVPNLQAEFKDPLDALGLAGVLRVDSGEEIPQVVQRGSPEEQELLDYSRKMLPATG